MTQVIPESCAKCGHLTGCVCTLKKEHKKGCLFRRAALLSVEVACPHGFQACPKCDPCRCGIVVVGIR